MRTVLETAAVSIMAAIASGCTPAVPTEAMRPDGETDLSCSAVIFAATNLVDVSKRADVPVTEYIGVVTRYATAHAESEGVSDPQEALGQVKLAAYRLRGTIPGGGGITSDEAIVSRAKACAGG